MTTVINTNIASLIAQNNLQSTQNSLTSAITDLSSGLKINSAADDPAGQAIATSLQSQVNGLTQAQANASNGISLAQTGQSALTQITDNLQTIRTLAVEASNASLTAENRASLNQEVQQSVAQINTIASTTNFNGENLLDGTFGLQNFQIGADAGQVIGVNLSQGAKASQIGQTDTTTLSLEGSTGLESNTFNVSIGGAATVSVANATAGTGAGENSDSAYAAAAAINNSDISGLTATASNTQQFSLTNVTNTSSAAETYNLTINGVSIFGATGESVAGGGSLSSTTIFNAINADSSSTGVSATFNSDGSINLTSPTGVDITVSETASATTGTLSGGLSNTSYLENSATAKGTLSATAYGTALSSTSGELQGSITLSSSDSIALSGSAITGTAAAGGIALQYDNTHNAADNLIDLGTTVVGSAAVGTAATGIKGTSGDQFIVNGQSIVVGSAASASAEASAIATSISTNSVLKAEGITATASSTGVLTITGGTETQVDVTGTSSIISSVIGTGASSPTVNSYQAATAGSLAGISVSTVADAQAAIETVDAALNQVSTLQGQLGAVQNRFTSVISNLTASTQNATSAQSTIQDTDYASATSQLSRAQVLSQAATAIIAQANQLPQQVLKLLQ
jgi:flagellin